MLKNEDICVYSVFSYLGDFAIAEDELGRLKHEGCRCIVCYASSYAYKCREHCLQAVKYLCTLDVASTSFIIIVIFVVCLFVCLFVYGNIHILSTLHRLIIKRCVRDRKRKCN